jgi:hypothetical protein
VSEFDFIEAVCPDCQQRIILDNAGRFVRHNLPGWTKGSAARARRGAIVRPEHCHGSGIAAPIQ